MTEFNKVRKKYSLNNSYFKNRAQDAPATPHEVLQYLNQHADLPFEMANSCDWVYDVYVEYQKRTGVYHSQFFTPRSTALRVAELAGQYFDPVEITNVMDACCGFGMLTRPLMEKGYSVTGFDFSSDMGDLYQYFTGRSFTQLDLQDYDVHSARSLYGYNAVVSNPPYELKTCTLFFQWLAGNLYKDGIAIVVLPKGMTDKQRPKELFQVLNNFRILHREDMQEDFARVKVKAEIVVLLKK